MSKGLFITGTGTDIGKTYVTSLIVKNLRSIGLNAGYYKPALSGAIREDGELTPGDCKFVAQIAGLTIPPKELASYIFETAVSPHLAAKLERRPIEPEVIRSDFNKFAQLHDFITIEGCGGIICPLRLDDQTLMQTDIIKLLKLDILVVTPSGLGSINSAALTVHYAQSQSIAVRGLILNNYDCTNFLHQDNKQAIEQLTQTPVVACVANGETSLDMNTTALCSLYKEI
ncbi:MAG TPA: dethiobiotin synthase [Negativicutes bacterium]|nr:dethiobiotin synthase [Negativicutes bacterium]